MLSLSSFPLPLLIKCHSELASWVGKHLEGLALPMSEGQKAVLPMVTSHSKAKTGVQWLRSKISGLPSLSFLFSFQPFSQIAGP